ncbi:glycosyl transferase [Pedobacter sp. HMWF019]|uniref:glycosyl transferase n=1 Tax=Pedobacter sp. HMWF019 TaxID=2056856 RepID=UPI000D3AB2F9|nr:glycosyl transferase [Pedobacter sp. HMWF019]PTS97818.1 glycosyl transferase [Pedobacter sp. HMWF019]
MISIIDEFQDITLSTYIVSLTQSDCENCRSYVDEQFGYRSEFDVRVVGCLEGGFNESNLWRNIVTAVQIAIDEDEDVIVIVTDDHQFTDFYAKKNLITAIIEANLQGAAMLCGGIQRFGDAVPLNLNRFWVNTFESVRFIVLYKRIFKPIVKYRFKKKDKVDVVLSQMTSHKMILYPFISKEAASVTAQESKERMLDVAEITIHRLEKIRKVFSRYVKPNMLDGQEIPIL